MADTDKELDNTENLPGDPGQTPLAADSPQEDQRNAKERLYDKIPLTVKHLNIIIIVLIIALVLALVFGTLLGNGIL